MLAYVILPSKQSEIMVIVSGVAVSAIVVCSAVIGIGNASWVVVLNEDAEFHEIIKKFIKDFA